MSWNNATVLKASILAAINKDLFLRSLISSRMSGLLIGTTIFEKCGTVITLLQYLETEGWPEGMEFI
jgi:hypothetical protein